MYVPSQVEAAHGVATLYVVISCHLVEPGAIFMYQSTRYNGAVVTDISFFWTQHLLDDNDN
jgi:hypothetical protein